MAKNIPIQTVVNLTKDLNVLYVEDEEKVREYVSIYLNKFFNSVDIASHGVEGLDHYSSKDYDLIITDLMMPKMDGYAMIQKIREVDSEIPIVLFTSLSDKDSILKTVELKIDQYLIKPLDNQIALEAFYHLGKKIRDSKKLKELESKIERENIEKESRKVAKEIIDSYQSPCIVFSGEKISFLNDSFVEMIDKKLVKKVQSKKDLKKYVFDDRIGFLESIDDYDDLNIEKNIVSISNNPGRKIYHITKRKINLSGDGDSSSIFFFKDITLQEYQKMKLERYTRNLEYMLFRTRYKDSIAKNKEKKSDEEVSSDSSLNLFEYDILRKTHDNNKVTAAHYCDEIEDEISEEIDDLKIQSNEIINLMVFVKDYRKPDYLETLSSKLEYLAESVKALIEFGEFAYVVKYLSELLLKYEVNELSEKEFSKLSILLEGITTDLHEWIENVFINKSALDIHYLDASLFSNCLQVEVILSGEDSSEELDEDDFEFF